MAKMTKQTRAMVEVTNEYLKNNRIRRIDDMQFILMSDMLLRAHCYAGFNYYTVDGKLSGGNSDTTDHIQFYIVQEELDYDK